MSRARADRYDLVVIGGGTAGLVTAAIGARLGARTLLVERDRLGGECLWTGCVPSKALLASARTADLMRRADRFGLDPAAPGAGGPGVLASVREARARVQPHDDPGRFREMGVEVVEGKPARFTGPGTVAVGDREVEGRRIVVATGSRPAVPPVEGLEEAGFRTHETAFEGEELPASVAIVGGGPVGVEFAQAYRRLGSEVTLVEMEERILPREDAELAERLRTVLEEEGVRILTGRRAAAARREGAAMTLTLAPATGGSDGAAEGRGEGRGGRGETAGTIRAGEIFVAAGRRPNVEKLGLAEAGIERGRAGVVVDEKLRTSRRRVLAAGDVIGPPYFTHAADHEARTAARNALFPFPSAVDYTALPRAVFTDPELAGVGLTEAEARERHGSAVRVYRYDLAELDRAITDRSARGLVKLVADRGDRLLGAHVLGAHAGTMIAEAALAIRHGLHVPDLSRLVHPYPTMSEGIRRAADGALRRRLTPRRRRWLERWFRLARRIGL